MPLISGDLGTDLFWSEVIRPLQTKQQYSMSAHHLKQLAGFAWGYGGGCGSEYE